MRRLLLSTSLATLLAAAPPAIDLGNGHRLIPRAAFSDELGQTHTRLAHSYRGLRVWSSESTLHEGPAGTWQEPLPEAPRLDLDLTPSVPEETAHAAIRAHLGAAGAGATLTTQETVIVPGGLDVPSPAPGEPVNAAQVFHLTAGYALAYRIRAEAGGASWDYFLDAHDGRILHRIPLEMQDLPVKGSGNTLYSGKVTLDTTATATGFLLLDGTRGQGGRFGGNAVTDMNHTSDNSLGSLYFNYPGSDDAWGDGQVEPPGSLTQSATGMTVAADAAYGVQCVWDYFARIHGRNGWDGLGTALTTRVHCFEPGVLVDNAYWNGTAITITDPATYWPRSSVRTLAHEFAHGVTGSSAALVYKGESGGLNEATADIFGAMVPAFVKNGAGTRIGQGNEEWQITTTRTLPGGAITRKVLRDMILPSSAGSPDAWSSSLGALDPHDGSGPMNRAFYFLSQGAGPYGVLSFSTSSIHLENGMDGIGNDKAARIWYRALTTYLQPASTYLDARRAALRAAIDLFGAGSAENIAVRKAFGAINVGDPNATLDDLGPPTIKAAATVLGTTLTLTAEVSDNDRVASVLYLVDGVPLGQPTAAPFSLTVDAGRVLANGSHTLQAYALDPSGNQGAATPVTFELDNPYQQLLRDPGLEGPVQGSPWTGIADLATPFGSSDPPHGGRAFITIWGYQDLAVGQQVTLPAGAAEATLRLWTKVTAQAGGSVAGTLKVQVRSVPAAGQTPQVLATLLTLGAQDAWPDWVQSTLDLSRFIGQTVEIRLEGDGQGSASTLFRVDDITLVCGAVPIEAGVIPGRLALQAGTTSVPLSATVFGSPDQEVAWSVREAGGGTLGSDLRYTAPASPGVYHVIAAPLANPLGSAEVSIQVLPRIQVSPLSATLETGATLSLALTLVPGLDVAVGLQEGARGGTALRLQGTDTVLYTAPATGGSYHLDITDRADPTSKATVTLTVVDPARITLFPATRYIATGAAVPFAAMVNEQPSTQVVYSIQEGDSGGSLAADDQEPDSGVVFYTAPATAGVYHLIATSTIDPERRSVATVTVVASAAIDPPLVVLTPEALTTFSITFPGQGRNTPAVQWSASAGSIYSDGDYTAPASPGLYTVNAVNTSGTRFGASATVRVKSTDLDGDGRTAGDFGDLAALADDYGSVTPAGQADPADLNGDGVVDDGDVALAKAAFEGPPAVTGP